MFVEQYKPGLPGSSTRTDLRRSSSTSRVLSLPELSSFTRDWLISKPITDYFVANSLAKGSPTYPNPITAIFIYYFTVSVVFRFSQYHPTACFKPA